MIASSQRILILSTRLPYPLMGGDRIRIYNFCKVLAQHYRVDLLVINEGKVEQEHIAELKKLGIGVVVFSFSSLRCKSNVLKGLFTDIPLQVLYYYFKEVQQWIDLHINDYDAVICNHIRGAEYFRNTGIKKILDLHDAISLNYSRASQFASGLWKQIYAIENKRVLPYEIHSIELFDRSLIVSPVDRDFLIARGANGKKISVLPVAVDDSVFSENNSRVEKDWIVFVGKMKTVANSDAAVYFATSIFPNIRSKMPNIEFFIVGADPSPKVQELKHLNGVHVTGKVENHLEYIAQAKVIVDPMRFGAGMQNKVLEAMAMRKPVVASSLALEGIAGKSDVHFITADTAEECSARIIQLFSDSSLRDRLAGSAATLAQEKYSWNVVGRSLLSLVDNVLSS